MAPTSRPWPANLNSRSSDPVFGRNPHRNRRRRRREMRRREVVFRPQRTVPETPKSEFPDFPKFRRKTSQIRRPARDRPIREQIAPKPSSPDCRPRAPNYGLRFRLKPPSDTTDRDVENRRGAKSFSHPRKLSPKSRRPNFRSSQFPSGGIANPQVGPRPADLRVVRQRNLGPG